MPANLPGELASQWHKAKKPLGLLLDYDGTLTPIVDDPAAATLTLEHAHFLTLLAQQPTIYLAVVSGRSLSQLQQFLPRLFALPVLFSGLHGGQISVMDDLGERSLVVDVTQPHLIDAVQQFKQMLTLLISPLQGYTLEDKTLSLTLHYKNMSEDAKKHAITVFMDLFQSSSITLLNQAFRVQEGKDVLELLPLVCNKGQATSWILNHWQNKFQVDVLPCYMGDDLTDESAFDVVNQCNGLSFCVGKAPEQTKALYTLASVKMVYTELASLINL